MPAGDADFEANALLTSLVAGEDFTIPSVDLTQPEFDFPGNTNSKLFQDVAELSNDDLTTRVVGGTGTFDALMESLKTHLQEEFEAGRITGAEYTKAYIAMAQGAMANATQFLLAKEQSFWQAQTAQVQAIQGLVGIESEKLRASALKIEANAQKAAFARAKLSLATEEVAYETARYTVDFKLPAELALVQAQKLKVDADTTLTETQNTKLAGADTNLITSQIAKVDADTNYVVAQTGKATSETQLIDSQKLKTDAETTMLGTQNLKLQSEKALVEKQTLKVGEELLKITAETTYLGSQKAMVDAETLIVPKKGKLLDEQMETQRANTLDTRSDGLTAIVGSVGKQKDLYSQQITSYQRDSEIKAAKIFSDSWITQKTIDEGVLAPNGFTNASIDTVLTALKTNNGLG